MGNIFPFRKPGEKCTNCIHYVPQEEHGVSIIDGPPNQYCRHPDRLKGYYLTEDIINELHLYRSPDEWCTKYKRLPQWKTNYPENELISSIDCQMVYIGPGTFIMGTPGYIDARATHTSKEKRHTVTLTEGFYIGVTVVTQSQWLRVMGSKSWPYDDEMLREGDEYPVTWISWEDSQRFINKLNEIEGTSAFRMPTEAEWEYSCRAGSELAYPHCQDKESMGIRCKFPIVQRVM